jgi:flagellar export protein FliJ
MKRFHFSLQSVATLRELRELRARENLAAAIRVCERTEIALADARARRDLLEDLVRSGRAFTLRAAEHVSFLGALRSATNEESAAKRAVDEAHAIRDRKLSEYYDAARALKVLSNLEVRARAAHRVAAEREEQNALDERASIAGANGRRYLS